MYFYEKEQLPLYNQFNNFDDFENILVFTQRNNVFLKKLSSGMNIYALPAQWRENFFLYVQDVLLSY